MNSIIRKKLNLLIRLAKSDGEFHKSERKMIKTIADEAGVEFDSMENLDIRQADFVFADEKDKVDVLFLALKLIQADEVITDEELRFGRDVAIKLNYKPALIDHFVNKTMPNQATFENEIKEWAM